MLLLVTPVRDEESFLAEVINGVKNQKLRPSLWVLVDHDSTDKSPEIISDLVENENWVASVRVGKDVEGYGSVVGKGIDCAVSLAKEKNINWTFLGVLDADIVLGKDYFQRLTGKFNNNRKLGIASGGLVLENNEKLLLDKMRAWGAHMVFSRECYEAIGGFPEGLSVDSIAQIVAVNRGFFTQNFPELPAKMLRRMSEKSGLHMGYRKRGRSSAYLGEKFRIALAKMFYYSKGPGFGKGFSFMRGYLSMKFLERKKAPEEIREHYSKKKLLPLVKKRIKSDGH